MKPSAWTNWLNLVLGAWLIVAEFTVHTTSVYSGGGFAYQAGAPQWNDLAVAVLLVLFGLIGGFSGASWASAANLALGIWLVLSAFVLFSPGAAAPMTNDVFVGMLVVFVSGAALWAGGSERPA
jgi:hypothetical protein